MFSELPKDGLFFPAVQNKTAVAKQKSSLKVHFKFDQPIPKEKAEIASNLMYSSDDGKDDLTNDDMSVGTSMHGGHSLSQSANHSMIQNSGPQGSS